MAFLTDLATAFALQSTDRSAALARLMQMWDAQPPGDRAGQCILAHYIADLQPHLADEVRWDETALKASQGVTDADLQKLHPTLTVAGFIPSLALNVADGYRRLGRFDCARDALANSIAHNDALLTETAEQIAYAELIHTGQSNLADKIAGEVTQP